MAKKRNWHPSQRVTEFHQSDADPDPWKNKRYMKVVDKYAAGSYKQKGSKWINKAVWYFAYKDQNHPEDAPFDNFTVKEVLTIS